MSEMTNEQRIVDALRRIRAMEVDILNDRVRVCALLGDIEPELKRERRRIRLFYETGAVRSLAAAVSSADEAQLYLEQAVRVLTTTADMTASAATATVNYFTPLWYGLPRLDKPAAEEPVPELFLQFDEESAPVPAPRKGISDEVSVSGAQQLTEQLLQRYAAFIPPRTAQDTAFARWLSYRAMDIAPLFPSLALKLFARAAQLGGAERLSLMGRQILALPGHLGEEPALGYLCVKTAVDRGARLGCFTLGYCFHNGVGVPRCSALAERYYRLAATVDPSHAKIIEKYILLLERGKPVKDTRWRFG